MSDKKYSWASAADILKDIPKHLQDAIITAPMGAMTWDEIAEKQRQYINHLRDKEDRAREDTERIQNIRLKIIEHYNEIETLRQEIRDIEAKYDSKP